MSGFRDLVLRSVGHSIGSAALPRWHASYHAWCDNPTLSGCSGLRASGAVAGHIV